VALSLARIALERGDLEHALELLDAANPVVARTGDAYEIATLQIEQACVLAQLDRRDEATPLTREAAAALRNAAPADAAHGYALAAEVMTIAGDHLRAAELRGLAVDAEDRTKLASATDS
jgi:hypothetical protein